MTLTTPLPSASSKGVPALDAVQVAEPCTVAWNSMRGDDTVRFCGQCRMNVYDLSAVTRPEAEALLRGRGERLCVRFQRRADGTLVSADCGPVRRSIRRRARVLRVAAAGIFAMFFPATLAGCGRGPVPQTNAGTPATVPTDPDDDVPHLQGEVYVPEPVMGIVACPAPMETPEGAPEDDAPPK